MESVIGVVLAGGRSMRMRTDKASLLWQGQTFLDRAISLLQSAGVQPVVVLGRPDHPNGIADRVSDCGPGVALLDFLAQRPVGTRALVIPVDMPFLTADLLRPLLETGKGCRYQGHVMPAVLLRQKDLPVTDRVSRVVNNLSEVSLSVPEGDAARFASCNTPEDLQKARQLFEK
ncbi:molybdenum cofactor guanylyltransferase [Kordiimonas sediminis]|uniref:Molybdenum cofactor guanylyltransferase n=1 Tax=Kordiimonas sediminis TaxID=1735581 RepID=A0A919AQZ6_9PROT|nr:molybdenum cofactor guanylyltransferase [Kordiimonas sediminis]GHF20539.1 molybdenum cofactor guanylyltransferase [Kordiimonas sediminis]